MNRVELIGNVGKDPEIKTLESGMKVANFSIATSETFKDKQGEKQTNTEWHNIVIWGKLADVVEKYVKKGDKLFVAGKIKTRKHEDKYYTDIVVHEMLMLGNKSTASEGTQQENAPIGKSEEPDDLPF